MVTEIIQPECSERAGRKHGGHPVPEALCAVILSERTFSQHLLCAGRTGPGHGQMKSLLSEPPGEVGQIQHSKVNTELEPHQVL